MKTSLLPAAAALLLAGTGCGSRSAAPAPEPIRLIVETDMGNDIDDALAFDLIYKAMDDGRVDLLAIGNHKLSPTATDYIDILNTWYGYPDIPLAQSPTPVLNDHAPDYTAAVCAMTREDGSPAFARSKTPEQIARIVDAMRSGGQDTILITRMSDEAAAAIDPAHPFTYYEMGRIGIVGSLPSPDGSGKVVVATGGTSDMPVAEEAALTAEALGNEVVRLYDVGVAGLHRLLSHLEELMSANVIIAIAGMEGALASVIGGLADCPVIAVPTSIGYGACFHGLSSLLSMLNSCASGVSVVNIDNGFGAGYLASMINHMGGKQK